MKLIFRTFPKLYLFFITYRPWNTSFKKERIKTQGKTEENVRYRKILTFFTILVCSNMVSRGTFVAPICCVIPPASPSWTCVCLSWRMEKKTIINTRNMTIHSTHNAIQFTIRFSQGFFFIKWVKTNEKVSSYYFSNKMLHISLWNRNIFITKLNWKF